MTKSVCLTSASNVSFAVNQVRFSIANQPVWSVCVAFWQDMNWANGIDWKQSQKNAETMNVWQSNYAKSKRKTKINRRQASERNRLESHFGRRQYLLPIRIDRKSEKKLANFSVTEIQKKIIFHFIGEYNPFAQTETNEYRFDVFSCWCYDFKINNNYRRAATMHVHAHSLAARLTARHTKNLWFSFND